MPKNYQCLRYYSPTTRPLGGREGCWGRFKLCVINIDWNKPPYIPIPLSLVVLIKLENPKITKYNSKRKASRGIPE